MTLAAILIAEESPRELSLLRQHLTKAGVKNPLVTFRDADDLKSFLRSTSAAGGTAAVRPSLLLLDLNLPKAHGLETLRWIREQTPLRDLPVVVLSSAVEPKDVKRAASLGVTRFVTKPLSPRTLADRIAEAIAEN